MPQSAHLESSLIFNTLQIRRLQQSLTFAVCVAAAFGLFLSRDTDIFLGYMAVILSAGLPSFLWLGRGAPGIPIMPVVALAYIPTYAFAAFSESDSTYSSAQFLDAQLTIAAFLATASLTAGFFGAARFQRAVRFNAYIELRDMSAKLAVGALLFGATFQIALMFGLLEWLGSAAGSAHTIAGTVTSIGCYFFGYAMATRAFRPAQLVLAIVLFAVVILMEIRTLYLYSALIDLVVVTAGYAITARRVPWLALGLGLIVAVVLSAAKSEMRERYWVRGTGIIQGVSLAQLPDFVLSWLEKGAENIGSGRTSDDQGFLRRASQLDMIMLVEDQSPRNIAFLDGATYANFPKMLVPRFIDPNKIISQENLSVLSVHYGLQTSEDKLTTTLSWGLVAEAYANFGFAGVVGAAIAFGILVGLLTSVTIGVSPISLGGLVGLASLVSLIPSIAYDFSYLLLDLLQALASVIALSLFFSVFAGQTKRASSVSAGSVRTNATPLLGTRNKSDIKTIS